MTRNGLTTGNGSRMRLRFDAHFSPELRCPWCGEWLPITPEFWEVRADIRPSWDACRACLSERSALYQRLRREVDPAWRARQAQRARDYRGRTRAWIVANAPELLPVWDRERKVAQAARQRASYARRRAA